jgi:indolepyruvate ferredoxin oxidoreductase beta subunit
MAHFIIGLEPLETIRILFEYGNKETIFIVNARPIHPLNVIAGDVEYPDLEWIRSVLAQAGDRLYWLDATGLALEMGAPIFLNMIMLGALSGLTEFPLEIGDFKEALKQVFPESKLKLNYRALDMGMALLNKNEN